ncbi:hypothetical protein ACFX1T_016896 [Malus domestica]
MRQIEGPLINPQHRTFLQSTILESVGCVWFNRSEAKDREIVTKKLRDHVLGADNNPLLIFPEGTCVNNHYTVMFKKGAFEIGCSVCPVAIKVQQNFRRCFVEQQKAVIHNASATTYDVMGCCL